MLLRLSNLSEPVADFTGNRALVRVMTDIERRLAQLLRAHAPAVTSASLSLATLSPDLELSAELGFDIVALAELTVAIDDAFGIDIAAVELSGCQTVRDLQDLVAARIGRRAF